MFPAMPFIEPCLPTLRKEPPAGPGWVQEVKFDGFRAQVHRNGQHVAIYSRNGKDLTRHYPALVRTLLKIPTQKFIIDGELCACDGEGNPDFGALLMRLADEVCIWVFDILSARGKDYRQFPYATRQYKRDLFMGRVGSPLIRKSETFFDPHALLHACGERKLEGIVSKRFDRPYRSGRTTEWVKVKCAGWTETNRWRHEFFNKHTLADRFRCM
jgi:bifunctional non-homologous end joining protein LigD